MPIDIDHFVRNLHAYEQRHRDACARAVHKFAWAVIGRAQELAPVETGFLKASGIATEPVVNGMTILCRLGFNAHYAAAVHEILTNHHPEGQAKYLETAMREMAPKFMSFIKAELDKEFP